MAVIFRGVRLDQSSVNKLELAEKWIGFTLGFAQGSYSTGVSASAGTHSGGGAVDVKCIGYSFLNKIKVVHYLRAVGFAAWHRPPNWDGVGGGEHIHCEEIGNPNLSPAARQQITQWSEGRNGLAGQAKDTDSIDVGAGRPAIITTAPHSVIIPPPEDDGMYAIIKYPKGSGWKGDFLLSGLTLHHIKTEAAEAVYRALGAPVHNLTAAQFNALAADLGGTK